MSGKLEIQFQTTSPKLTQLPGQILNQREQWIFSQDSDQDKRTSKELSSSLPPTPSVFY